MVQSSIPSSDKKDFNFFKNIQTSFGNHSASYSIVVRGSGRRKQPMHKDDQPPTSGAVIKNGWSYLHTSSLPACFHVMNRNNLTTVNFKKIRTYRKVESMLSYLPPAAITSNPLRLRFFFNSHRNWHIIPEYCWTLYTSPGAMTIGHCNIQQ